MDKLFIEDGIFKDDAIQQANAFYEQLIKEMPSIDFLEFKFSPTLKNLFKQKGEIYGWSIALECNLETEGKLISKKSLPKKVNDLITNYAEEFWAYYFSLYKKNNGSTPWDGLTFYFTLNPKNTCIEDDKNQLLRKVQPTFHYYVGRDERKEARRIIGVLQVKNSDLSINEVIDRSLVLVDELIILDNESDDGTGNIIEKRMQEDTRIVLRKIMCVTSGSRFLHPLCGTDTIVIKLDSDEIWDKQFFNLLRQKLKRLNLRKVSLLNIENAELFVENFDVNNFRWCVGSLRKAKCIFNFGTIWQWPQNPERLHGTQMKIIPGAQPETINLQDIDESRKKPALLHFSLLNLCSNGPSEFVPGWLANKLKIMKHGQKSKLTKVNIEDFNIKEMLEACLPTNTQYNSTASENNKPKSKNERIN